MVISINGEFYARRVTGIERVARFTVLYLDEFLLSKKITPKRQDAPTIQFELVVPSNAADLPVLKNIPIIKLPVEATFFPKWTQIDYQSYVLRNKRISLDFANTCPYFSPGFAYIHDIYAVLYPADYNVNLREKLVAFYSRAMYKRIAKKAKLVLTVSEYSKKTIIDKYHVDESRLRVVYSGYEKDEATDDSIFSKLDGLQEKQFYFTLGSLSVRKNIDWVIEHARLFPKEHFVVSGNALPHTAVSSDIPKNITFAGYLSDAQVHSLFAKCKAFLFPSHFEGFGIPPLEALSFGAKVIVAKNSALAEIYGDCAYYIDDNVPDIDLDAVLARTVSSPLPLLQKFTLKNSAARLWDAISAYFQ